MSLRNFAYDHPSYVARQTFPFGAITAGSAGVTSKFSAHAQLLIYGLTSTTMIAGTSTSTATFPPQPPSTATTQVQANGQILSLLRVANTVTAAGTAPSLTTTTYGPFVTGSLFANGTFTAAIGNTNQYAINSLQIVGPPASGTATTTTLPNAGLSNQGGILVNQGDVLFVVSGTDATATTSVTLDYQIQPLASVTA